MVGPSRLPRSCVRPHAERVCPGASRARRLRRKPVKKQRWARVCFLAVLAAPFSAAKQARADEWKPISADELKMASLPEAPGAAAVILYREVNRDDGRTPHEDNYVRIKILTEEGRKYANVEIPYFRESASVAGIKARCVRPDGSVMPFEGRPVDQTIVKAKGIKYLAKTFSLPDVQVGSI